MPPEKTPGRTQNALHRRRSSPKKPDAPNAAEVLGGNVHLVSLKQLHLPRCQLKQPRPQDRVHGIELAHAAPLRAKLLPVRLGPLRGLCSRALRRSRFIWARPAPLSCQQALGGLALLRQMSHRDLTQTQLAPWTATCFRRPTRRCSSVCVRSL